MAKKSTSKKPTTKAKSTDTLSRFDECVKKWTGWSKLSTWEDKSGQTKEYWKEFITDKATKFFKKKYLKISENWEDNTYFDLLKAAKNQVYLKEYADLAKTFTVSTDDYLIKIFGFTGYNDWAAPKIQNIQTEYFAMTAEQQLKVEGIKVRIERDKAKGTITNVIPLMGSFKKGEYKDIPPHSYMGTAIGAAMPVVKYEQALKEGEDSEAWDTLMPLVLNCNGENFGNPESKHYVNIQSGGLYRGTLSIERGKKITEGDKFYYLYEGHTTDSYDEIDGKKIKVTSYEGPRSFQYNLKLAELKDETPCLTEIEESEFNIPYENLFDRVYTEWNLGNFEGDEDYVQNGNAGLEKVVDYYNNNSYFAKDRSMALYPFAFEASIIEAKINTPENDTNGRVSYSIRIDDNLDEKGIKDGDNEFRDLTLYGIEFSEDQIARFKTLSPATRIKLMCLLYRKKKSRIQGNVYDFMIVKSTSPDKVDFSDPNAWDLEDDEDESEEEDDDASQFEIDDEEEDEEEEEESDE